MNKDNIRGSISDFSVKELDRRAAYRENILTFQQGQYDCIMLQDEDVRLWDWFIEHRSEIRELMEDKGL